MSSLRRPASSTSLNPKPAQKPRSRAPSVVVQPPPSRRPLSTISSQQAASRASTAHVSASEKANALDDAQKRKAGEAGETNIQVVVRVRGHTPSEIAHASSEQSILSTTGARSQQIDVAIEPAPVSSSSMLQQEAASTRQKSYHFDQVFGPEADQGMVYQDVVGPILEQVMSGYNCTIFAYGQTGTGKTFTMEGDLTSQMGTYSADAGIIPRTLYRLFHTLELSKDDYSVKSTFIELYNEELRDLLSTDASSALEPSVGSNQHGLRMYDDARGKGVVIQGLEEVILKDAAHGLTVLRRGSHKRQIAATNCNEQSSRSHSVFTMTVYIKDKGSKGEDVLKIGKLNLVDLAGSENIGRSGAENKRAREAGMINQSLLTLGRVINALVDKNSHIPYRESKLTRLLQESLGGRTKTCIIATVSQDRSNIEETLSTLDYALRAKSIKNRPELNTRMTRAALIKEYVFEIERLKGDLQASRDQNGIYLTNESWTTMHAEHEERKLLADTLKRNAELTESKLTSLKEQFEQNMQLLVKRDNEVRLAKAECQDTVTQLQDMIARAAQLEATVQEEMALRKAYKASEAQLSTTTADLTSLVHQSTADVQGLFDKLERKSAVLEANRSLAVDCRQAVSTKASQLESQLVAFHQAESGFFTSLQAGLQTLTGQTEEQFTETSTFAQTKLKKISASLREVRTGQMESKDVLAAVVQDLQTTVAELQSSSETSLSSLKHICRAAIDDLVSANDTRFETVRTSLDELVESHTEELHLVRTTNAANLEQITQLKAASDEATAEELVRLRAQNSMLEATVDEMKRSNEAMKQTLMHDISQLVTGFVATQEDQLSTSLQRARASVMQSETASQDHATQHNAQLTSLASAVGTVASQLQATQQSLVTGAGGIAKSIKMATGELGFKLGEFVEAVQHDLDSGGETTDRAYAHISTLATTARDEVDTRTKVQSAKLKSLNGKLTETMDQLDQTLHSASDAISTATRNAADSVGQQQSDSAHVVQSAVSHLSALQVESSSILESQTDDVPTGQTPQKRQWQLPAPYTLVPTDRLEAIQAGYSLIDDDTL